MNLQKYYIDGESIAFITLYGENRSSEVTEWHQKVMTEHFSLPINYIKVPFENGVSHGWAMNEVLKQTLDSLERPTYYGFIDNDAFFLKKNAVSIIHSIVSNKLTLFGHGWNSQHKTKPRGGNHPYASQATIFFASELYDVCGRPNMDHHNPRSDTAEEFTFEIENRGYILSLIYPSSCTHGGSPLSQTANYGRGNIYGPNLMFHQSRADLPDHVDGFVNVCKRVISGEFEK